MKRAKKPVWGGPERDGVTFSLLSRYLCCKERFRLLTVEGLRPAPSFNAPIEFGQMWHLCESVMAEMGPTALSSGPLGRTEIERVLAEHTQYLCRAYPLARDSIWHWYNVASVMFPLYAEYWRKHPDVTDRRPLLQEKPFDVSYQLPSGRGVRLRGKWDSVDVIEWHVWLQENKTKSRIDQAQLTRQLKFDLQTMLYLTALHEGRYDSTLNEVLPKGSMLAGVRYNVVKRPGQYQGKKETPADFRKRLAGLIREAPAEFFLRWKVDVSQNDVTRFGRQCLGPLLENLCDDYEWWAYAHDQHRAQPSPDVYDYQRRAVLYPDHRARHYRHPFGVYNSLDEGGCSDLDAYLDTGSTVGLEYAEDMFPELV